MIYVIIWICFGIISAMIASNKGNSTFVGFLLGALLGPIGLLISWASSNNEEELRKRKGENKKCPYCAEYVKDDAIVCKHCGRTLRTNEPQMSPEEIERKAKLYDEQNKKSN